MPAITGSKSCYQNKNSDFLNTHQLIIEENWFKKLKGLKKVWFLNSVGINEVLYQVPILKTEMFNK